MQEVGTRDDGASVVARVVTFEEHVRKTNELVTAINTLNQRIDILEQKLAQAASVITGAETKED